MDIDQARAVINEQHRAVLATMRGDGTPQMSPVVVCADAEGRVMISTRKVTAKVHNVRRDPRVWICVLPDEFYGSWIQVDGTAEIVELPDAMDLLIDYFRRVGGEHPDWDDYREAMYEDDRVIMRVELTRAGPKPLG